jgi:hypothetical protein
MIQKYILPILGKAFLFGAGVWFGYSNTSTINSIKQELSSPPVYIIRDPVKDKSNPNQLEKIVESNKKYEVKE